MRIMFIYTYVYLLNPYKPGINEFDNNNIKYFITICYYDYYYTWH